jgi:hypothetical protein
VLACASVLGLEFEPAIVGAAGGLPEETVLSALDEAIAARLVIEAPGPVPRNRFSHALVRATLYDELTAARRVALHRKVAEAIEEIHGHHLDDHLPALAHHWARASAPAAETSRAVEYARRAGDRALAQFANDEAAVFFREALELLDVAGVDGDDGRRLPLLVSLGEAERRAGIAAHRETLLAAAALAHRVGDDDALARAVLANTRGFIPSLAGVVDTDRVAALKTALAALPSDDSPVRARVLATLSLELTFSPDPGHREWLSDEAVAMARRVDNRESLAYALLARLSATLYPGTLQARLSDTAEMVGLVESLPDPAQRVRALVAAYRTVIVAGRMDEADQFLQAADALARELAQPSLRWMTRVLQAARALLAGTLEAAERLAVEASEFGRLGSQRDAAWAYAHQRLLIRMEQGQVDEETAALIHWAADDFREAGGGLDILDLDAALADVALGRTPQAQAIFERVGNRPPTADYFSILTDVLRAQLALRLGEAPQLEVQYQRLHGHPDWVVPFSAFPSQSVSFHLGALAAFLRRFDDAERHFAAAAEDHKLVGAPTFLARTRLEWARMLLARGGAGDNARAHTLLTAACAAAGELGLAGIERDAAALLGR